MRNRHTHYHIVDAYERYHVVVTYNKTIMMIIMITIPHLLLIMIVIIMIIKIIRISFFTINYDISLECQDFFRNAFKMHSLFKQISAFPIYPQLKSLSYPYMYNLPTVPSASASSSPSSPIDPFIPAGGISSLGKSQ